MVSEKEKYEDYYDCPYTTAMKVIGGKWKVVIIGHLMEGEKRSSALKRLIPGVTQKMFTQQLRELEADGIIHREIYKEIPPKDKKPKHISPTVINVEYRLTDFGKSFSPVLNELLVLGQKIIAKQNQD